MPGKHAHGSAFAAALFCLALLAAPACGKRGAPMPPEPRGPLPPRGVTVRQIGDRIEMSFRLAPARGPRPAQQAVRVELVRVSYAPGMQPPTDPGAFRRRGVVVAAEDGDPIVPGTELRLADTGLQDPAASLEGRTLRYAVRARDRRGRKSPLVAAPDLVPLQPVGEPRSVAAVPTADGIRLTWQPPEGSENPVYNLYRARGDAAVPPTPLNKEPLSVEQYLDSDVEQGETYGYVVRVVLAEGRPFREGRSAPRAQVVAVDRYAPAAPERLVIVQEGRAVRLFWDPNREPDLAGYRVYRSVESGSWERIGPDPLEQASYLDTEVEFERRIRYRVSAVDRAGNEGPACEPQELEVRPEPAEPGGLAP